MVIHSFKGLDLLNRVPEELWTEVHNIVQEAADKIIPKKKKCKKAKRLSEAALQIAEERREAKSKGERERYTQRNAESWRIARRDKKAFFNEQCTEIEDHNRRGKTRDLFKKIGNIKGTFNPKMGTIKARNSKDLIEAEEIMKRWQEYTEELYKKDPNNLDNHNGVITHLEPDILECEVKWEALLSIKLVEVIEFQQSCLKSSKMMLFKCCTQYVSKFGKPSSGHRTGKVQSSSQFLRRALLKNVQTTRQLYSSPVLVR